MKVSFPQTLADLNGSDIEEFIRTISLRELMAI
jgi:hypothetical protein